MIIDIKGEGKNYVTVLIQAYSNEASSMTNGLLRRWGNVTPTSLWIMEGQILLLRRASYRSPLYGNSFLPPICPCIQSLYDRLLAEKSCPHSFYEEVAYYFQCVNQTQGKMECKPSFINGRISGEIAADFRNAQPKGGCRIRETLKILPQIRPVAGDHFLIPKERIFAGAFACAVAVIV